MPASTPNSVEAPQKQAPMEMEATRDGLVTAQPSSEPQPRLEKDEPKLSLRGGGMNVGFTCCGGHCSFHKHCC